LVLIKDGLGEIVNKTEAAPTVATIVLVIKPNFLYLIGADPTDPVVIGKVLADQFQLKT